MELDAFQRAAATDPSEHLSIEAPAGSGKTRVLVERVAWLVEHGHAPAGRAARADLCTSGGAGLRERLAARGLGAVPALTFHAWAYQLLRSIHTTSFRLLTDVERTTLLRRLLISLARDGTHGALFRALLVERNWSPTFAARELLATLETLRSFGRSSGDLAVHCARATNDGRGTFALVLLELWRRFEAVLDRHSAYDFPLLVRRAAERLANWPTRAAPATRLAHVLIDEAQDASRAELDLITGAVRTTVGAGAATTWVGDPNQSVYAWRGAAPLAQANLTRTQLRCCYRSDARVVRLVNAYLHSTLRHAAVPAVAVRPAARTPQLVLHPRYGEPAALRTVLTYLAHHGVAGDDILVLARCHAPLERLAEVEQRFRGVRFATVHAAKGLEARAVILVGVSDDRFCFPLPARTSPHPLVRALASYDQAAEERRLFYVALTRARDHLILLSDADRLSPLLGNVPRRTYRRASMAALPT
ncbi:MAG: UvrD-helicase domain-containing protein [Candidatus Andersenbacteria bacterium]